MCMQLLYCIFIKVNGQSTLFACAVLEGCYFCHCTSGSGLELVLSSSTVVLATVVLFS